MSLLRLESVAKSYWRGLHESRVLRGASLEVERGTLVSIYGPRNSGKTALLRIAAGFEAPDGGMVTFEDGDLAGMSAHELAALHRDRIGWIERAGPHAPELTVGDYVALALYRRHGPRVARRHAAAALERYGVGEHFDARWGDLSDSARALCAIAQAMVRGPRLLIADDPTAGLGILDRERVCAALRSAADAEGVGVLMAVPDMPAMLRAHAVLLLSRGRLLQPAGRLSDAGDEAEVLEFPHDRRSA